MQGWPLQQALCVALGVDLIAHKAGGRDTERLTLAREGSEHQKSDASESGCLPLKTPHIELRLFH
jgi:hypothetical protein